MKMVDGFIYEKEKSRGRVFEGEATVWEILSPLLIFTCLLFAPADTCSSERG